MNRAAIIRQRGDDQLHFSLERWTWAHNGYGGFLFNFPRSFFSTLKKSCLNLCDVNIFLTWSQEDMKVKAIEALRKKTYEEGIMFMIKRNREKISEIWFIIDKNRDEIDFMKQQVLHGDVSSVRA